MPTTSTRGADSLYHPYDNTILYTDHMQASSLEILLLAIGVLFLVALMGCILYLGYLKRQRERTQFQSTHSSVCLWDEVFSSKHTNHDPILISFQPYSDDSPSFIDKVRKRSESYARALQHELRDISRNLGTDSALEPDLEFGMAGSVSEKSENTWTGTDRRWSSGADVNSDPTLEGQARRRMSSFVRPGELGRRGGYEHAVSDGW
jgi:hypothetical protein